MISSTGLFNQRNSAYSANARSQFMQAQQNALAQGYGAMRYPMPPVAPNPMPISHACAYCGTRQTANRCVNCGAPR